MEYLGRTPAPEPLVIPPCCKWTVRPLEAVPPADLLRELDRQRVVGLELANYPAQALEELLAGIEHLPQLRFLDLAFSGANDASLRLLGNASQLEELNLWGKKITDAGLEHLEGLRKLRKLGLSTTGVTNAGLKHLAGMKQLQSLLLPPRVSDAGLEHLQDLKQLRTLAVPGGITNAGLAHLAAMPQLRELLIFAKASDTEAG